MTKMWKDKTKQVLTKGVMGLRSFAVQVFVIVAFGVVVMWLFYSIVWVSLVQEAGLPEGLPPSDPELNSTQLEKIIQQRQERLDAPKRPFGARAVVQDVSVTP